LQTQRAEINPGEGSYRTHRRNRTTDTAIFSPHSSMPTHEARLIQGCLLQSWRRSVTSTNALKRRTIHRNSRSSSGLACPPRGEGTPQQTMRFRGFRL